jgi:hypothetical protein
VREAALTSVVKDQATLLVREAALTSVVKDLAKRSIRMGHPVQNKDGGNYLPQEIYPLLTLE